MRQGDFRLELNVALVFIIWNLVHRAIHVCRPKAFSKYRLYVYIIFLLSKIDLIKLESSLQLVQSKLSKIGISNLDCAFLRDYEP